RAQREDTVELWHKIPTAEEAESARRYHSIDPAEKAFGGRVEITLTDGSTVIDEIAVADAHPLGARPFGREQYIRKFRILAQPVLDADEIERVLELVQRSPELTAAEVAELSIIAKAGVLGSAAEPPKGLFRCCVCCAPRSPPRSFSVAPAGSRAGGRPLAGSPEL